jgi:hypothetical protein
LTSSVSLADIEYTHQRGDHSWVGDASLAWKVDDRMQLSGGGGVFAMDAFQAVRNQLKANYYYGGVALRPTHRTYVEARFSQSLFRDGVRRSMLTASAFHRIYFKPRLRLQVGASTEGLWHSHESASFWSPAFFQAHLAMLRAEGRLFAGFDYIAEIGTGVQDEPLLPQQYPLLVSGVLAKRLHLSLRLLLEAGYNSSSIRRVNPLGPAYSFSHMAVSLESRFD